jgi:hypothetical protein
MTPWLLLLMLEFRAPGVTHFSVTPVKDCEGLSACEGAKHSSFYGTWVRQETYDEGKERYVTLAAGQERAIEQILCVRLDGTPVLGCLPEPAALDKKTKKLLFGPFVAVAAMDGVAIPESGLREDVQVGRGFARACPKGGPRSITGVCGPSNDGGMGRGPGGEACVAQIHPSVGWMFADGDPAVLARAKAGDGVAREAIMQSLVGRDAASIERCWRTSLRMLLRGVAYCGWWLRTSKMRQDWDYAMYSLYGTGTSCVSGNNGKTIYRTELFRKLRVRARALAKQKP